MQPVFLRYVLCRRKRSGTSRVVPLNPASNPLHDFLGRLASPVSQLDAPCARTHRTRYVRGSTAESSVSGLPRGEERIGTPFYCPRANLHKDSVPVSGLSAYQQLNWRNVESFRAALRVLGGYRTR